MALGITVTKKEVTLPQPSLYSIVLNMVVTDAAVEVINKDYSIRYRPGQDIQVQVQAVQEQMQQDIDNYKASDVVFDHAKLDNAVTYLNTNLTG